MGALAGIAGGLLGGGGGGGGGSSSSSSASASNKAKAKSTINIGIEQPDNTVILVGVAGLALIGLVVFLRR